jgi:hypothetical protein
MDALLRAVVPPRAKVALDALLLWLSRLSLRHLSTFRFLAAHCRRRRRLVTLRRHP